MTHGFQPTRPSSVDGLPRARHRFSVWTVIFPLALTACVYVVASIIASARWTLGTTDHGASRTVRPIPARVVREYTTRAGDTWRRVARRSHVSVSQLHRLNPHDTARGEIVAGERLVLRS
jgi:hypothetical protein